MICNSNDRESDDDEYGGGGKRKALVKDEYESDTTSSYDSEGDKWYRHITMEIVHSEGNTPIQLCGFQGPHHSTNLKRCFEGDNLIRSETPAICNRTNKTAEHYGSPSALNDLFLATKPFYDAPAPASSTFAASAAVPSSEPSLQQGEGGVSKHTNKRMKRSGSHDYDLEDTYPRPSNNHINPRSLNDGRSRLPSPLISTITFQEALAATGNPRIICLSFPPFIVVHLNLAYTAFAGFHSHECLGQPLSKFFVGKKGEFPTDVIALQDRLATVRCKPQSQAQQQATNQCCINVALVGPEISSDQPARGKVAKEDEKHETQEEEDDDDEDDMALCVTHYSVEMEPVGTGQYMIPRTETGRDLRMALVTPDSSSFCGVLG